jgi:hypothetical protein
MERRRVSGRLVIQVTSISTSVAEKQFLAGPIASNTALALTCPEGQTNLRLPEFSANVTPVTSARSADTRWDKPSFLGEEETMPIYKKSKEDFATSAPPSRFGKLKWWFLLLLSGGVIAFIFVVFGQVGDLLEN